MRRRVEGKTPLGFSVKRRQKFLYKLGSEARRLWKVTCWLCRHLEQFTRSHKKKNKQGSYSYAGVLSVN